MANKSSALTPKELLLIDAKKFAAMLSISLSTFYRRLSDGKIGPVPVRLGGVVRFDLEEVRAWVRSRCPERANWEFNTMDE